MLQEPADQTNLNSGEEGWEGVGTVLVRGVIARVLEMLQEPADQTNRNSGEEGWEGVGTRLARGVIA
jgi:hypothetical protein